VGDPLSPGFGTPTNPFFVLMPNGVTYTRKGNRHPPIVDDVPNGLAIGHGKIQVKGKNVPLVALPLTTPVRVQLQQSSSTTCWEATYSTATSNTASTFKARSD
jgi:hypothetical protein